MKYEIRVSGIEKKLPKPFKLPATFDAFVETCGRFQRGDLGWFAIKYTGTKDLLGFDAKQELVPVLRLPDGGFVGLWFCSKRSPAVVWCGSEGEANVVGVTWSDFVLRLSKKRTGVPDLDDHEVAKFPSIRGVSGSLKPLTQKRREFKSWLKANQPQQAAATSDDASEEIRRELVELMGQHFDVDEEDDLDSDTVDLRVTLTSRSYVVEWLAGGYKAYPAPNRLRRTLDKLVSLLGRPLKKSEVCVWSDGCVFVDKNICLGDKRLYKT